MTTAHQTLKQENYEIHYFVSGEEHETAIVFLHPAFSDHRAFDLQLEFFAKNYKVICIDLLGHGLSKAKNYNEQLEASAKHINKIIQLEDSEKVHLVGVSMGGLIAQYFALLYPKQTLSLCAVGAYDINKDNKEVQRAQMKSNFGLIIKAMFSMKAFRKKAAEITCFTKEGKAKFLETMSHYERKSFMVMQGLQHVIKPRTYTTPSYSTLIMVGEYDIPLALKMAKDWSTYLGKSKYIKIKNAGHCANIDQAETFNQDLFDFIKG